MKNTYVIIFKNVFQNSNNILERRPHGIGLLPAVFHHLYPVERKIETVSYRFSCLSLCITMISYFADYIIHYVAKSMWRPLLIIVISCFRHIVLKHLCTRSDWPALLHFQSDWVSLTARALEQGALRSVHLKSSVFLLTFLKPLPQL